MNKSNKREYNRLYRINNKEKFQKLRRKYVARNRATRLQKPIPPIDGVTDEQWTDIPGFDEYLVSNYGRVRSKRNGRLMYPSLRGEKRCYLGVSIRSSGKSYSRYLHRLVALAFVPNPHNLPEVNHKDCNKMNNSACNLEWCTRIANMKHAARNMCIPSGEKHRCAKLTDDQVRELRKFKKDNPHISNGKIGRMYGLDNSNVWRIIKGENYKHVL